MTLLIEKLLELKEIGMTDIHKAKPKDIYIDESGDLWEVTWTCDSPTVCVERIYRPTAKVRNEEHYRIEKQGGINGYMWKGFRRLNDD